MENLDRIFLTRKGCGHILKHKNAYNYKHLKIKTLVRIHLIENPNSRLVDRKLVFESFLKDLGGLFPNSLDTDRIRAWLESLRAQRNYSEKTMSHIKCQINYLFKWLTKEGAYSVNPLDSIKFRQNLPPIRPRRVFNKEEVKQLLKASLEISPNLFYPFFYTLVHTGARRSEVLNLKIEHINFKRNTITFKETKNGEDRTIRMDDRLAKTLKKVATKESDYLFLGVDKLSRQKIQRYFSKLKIALPEYGENYGCHSMRHSFAYNFLKAGGEMYQLQAILGHKSIKMTVDLYGNLKSEDIENPSPYDF